MAQAILQGWCPEVAESYRPSWDPESGNQLDAWALSPVAEARVVVGSDCAWGRATDLTHPCHAPCFLNRYISEVIHPQGQARGPSSLPAIRISTPRSLGGTCGWSISILQGCDASVLAAFGQCGGFSGQGESQRRVGRTGWRRGEGRGDGIQHG